MEVKELRLKNYVMHKGQMLRVIGVLSSLEVALTGYNGNRLINLSHREVQPIPLTEEIVKKIFTKEEVLDDYILDVGKSRVLTYSVKADVFSLYFIKREGRVELNFLEVLIFEGLHDLQNWYYYNNNKTELEINL